MSALSSYAAYPGFKPIANKVVWDLFGLVQDEVIPVRAKVFGIPVSVNVKVSSLQPLIEMLVGTKGEFDSLPNVNPNTTQTTPT